ncbi:hypothetical protein [Nitrospira lenta]|uniref:Uncharacterized protein n=1 Tax=Nitrospira lenta TaxID=1436998 RepID=A0A330L7U7_9BACT|nr:hypothetical protein [Nitrospira lenta]SPP63006.1 conserved exported hypothetical protein [Nitrospira lenta]
MSIRLSTTGVLLFSALIGGSLPLHAAETMNGRLEIIGEYRYAARESEPIAEAKAFACREAWRQAVTSSSLYREYTAAVIDSPLLRELSSTLANRHVYDPRIVEQTERGRTLSCRVQGYLQTDESARVIRTQLTSGPSPTEGIDQNRALRILTVQEEANGVIAIQYQALKRLDWLGTHYQGGLRESADIMVDFYDEQGLLIKTERYQARRTATGDDVMSPGAIAVLKVTKPAGSKTYRAWLVK